MPYIKKSQRKVIDTYLDKLIEQLKQMTNNGKENNGIVTYVIYKLMVSLYGHSLARYENMSNALKILESAKLEFYRRKMAPYEDKKILENGDV